MNSTLVEKEEIPKRITKLMSDADKSAYDFNTEPEPLGQSTIANWQRGAEPGAYKLAVFAVKCGATPNDVLLSSPMPSISDELRKHLTPEDIEDMRVAYEGVAWLHSVVKVGSDFRPAKVVRTTIIATVEQKRQELAAAAAKEPIGPGTVPPGGNIERPEPGVIVANAPEETKRITTRRRRNIDSAKASESHPKYGKEK